MTRLSNAQGLLFVEIFQEEVKAERAAVTTLKGWFGDQHIGQAKAMISDSVSANRGVVTHTVGDATLSSFPDARSAVAAAVEIRNKLMRSRRGSTVAIVKARIGLSFGPVRVIAGKISGDAVTAAGLLMEKSRPDEILADKAVVEAAGTVPAIEFESHGSIEGIAAYLVLGGSAAEVAHPSRPGPAGAAREQAKAPAPAPIPPTPPAPAAAVPVKAIVLKFGGVEWHFEPAVGSVFLGRGKENHIVVPFRHVSRRHAKIYWPDGRMPCLVNLGANGSCVRSRGSNAETRVTDQFRLEGSGDLALCGSFGQVSSPDELISFRLVDL